MKDKIINVFLRGLTLGVRFLFIFALARYLDAGEFALYGLFTAAVGYLIYLVGLDFYTYSTRELLAVDADQRGGMIKAQIFLSFLLYILFLPLLFYFLYELKIFPLWLIFLMLPILMAEHINQELHRMLTAFSRQNAASILLFLRQASWAIVVVCIFLIDGNNIGLQEVLYLWSIFGVLSAAYGIYSFRALGFKGWSSAIKYQWLKKGVRVSFIFLLATLCLRGIQTFDRYFLNDLSSLDVVGAYILFVGVAGSLSVFLDASIFSYLYPDLINLKNKKKWLEFKRKVLLNLVAVIFLSLGFYIVSSQLIEFLIIFVKKEVYLNHINMFFLVVMAVVANSISMIPHYALYALGRDKSIVFSHVIGFLFFLLFTLFFKNIFSYLVVPYAVLASFCLVAVLKFVFYFQYLNFGYLSFSKGSFND